MSEPKFFQTRMGQRFYEAKMPELVAQLARLNDVLEKIADRCAHRAHLPDDEGSE